MGETWSGGEEERASPEGQLPSNFASRKNFDFKRFTCLARRSKVTSSASPPGREFRNRKIAERTKRFLWKSLLSHQNNSFFQRRTTATWARGNNERFYGSSICRLLHVNKVFVWKSSSSWSHNATKYRIVLLFYSEDIASRNDEEDEEDEDLDDEDLDDD